MGWSWWYLIIIFWDDLYIYIYIYLFGYLVIGFRRVVSGLTRDLTSKHGALAWFNQVPFNQVHAIEHSMIEVDIWSLLWPDNSPHQIMGKKQGNWGWYKHFLVGGLVAINLYFPINIGFRLSSQLTNIIFFSGVAQPPTSFCLAITESPISRQNTMEFSQFPSLWDTLGHGHMTPRARFWGSCLSVIWG